MRLPVDENLAPGLVERIADLFPGSVHVAAVGMGNTPDAVVWQYANVNQFTLLTKDKDFGSLSIIWGAPPKDHPPANRQLFDGANREDIAVERRSIIGVRARRQAQSADSQVVNDRIRVRE